MSTFYHIYSIYAMSKRPPCRKTAAGWYHLYFPFTHILFNGTGVGLARASSLAKHCLSRPGDNRLRFLHLFLYIRFNSDPSILIYPFVRDSWVYFVIFSKLANYYAKVYDTWVRGFVSFCGRNWLAMAKRPDSYEPGIV